MHACFYMYPKMVDVPPQSHPESAIYLPDVTQQDLKMGMIFKMSIKDDYNEDDAVIKMCNAENGVENQATVSASSAKQKQDVKDRKKENKVTDAKKAPFYKLFSCADSIDKALMVFGSIGAMTNGVSMPFMTILLGDVIDAFGDNQNTKRLIHLISEVSLKFVYLAIVAGIAAFLQVACWTITGERQVARLRNQYLEAILRQDIAFFDKETNTGEVVGSMSGDTVLIQDAMGEKVGQFLQLLSTSVGGFIIALTKGWLLTLVLLSATPFLVAAGAALSIIISRLASRGQVSYAKAAVVVDQTIGSIRTVASFTGEKRAIANYKSTVVTAYKAGIREGLASGTGVGVAFLVLYGTYALAVWFGSRMIFERDYTGGTVINVMIAMVTGSRSLGQASPCMSAFAAGQAAAYKMFKTINRKSEIDSYDPSGKILDTIRGDIELRDVYFSYPSRPDEQIFSGFSISVSSGTTAALVGQSGSGKSTMISLIERFYDPHAGHVLIDGINLKEFQLRWIRQKIGLVSQEPVLFASSIKDNIACGKDGATNEEIRLAAEIANADKFIDKLPQGIDTLVGDLGTQLSGGEKQRVAIARAIIKDPRILLLDEATSALDAESENIVQEAIDKITGNRTTIIVAHRLSTVRHADMIAVIHQGKVVEKGRHAELLKDPEGAYSQLISLQEMGKESEEAKDISGLSIQKIGLPIRSLSHEYSKTVEMDCLERALSETNSVKPDSYSKEKPDVSIWRLTSLNKPEIPALVLGSIFAIASGAISPIYGILLSSVIRTFYEPPHLLRRDSRFWSLVLIVIGVASFLTIIGRVYFFSVAGCKLIQRIRLMCFERIVHMEISWFDQRENSSGVIAARLSADAAYVRALVGDALGLLVKNAATAITGLLIAFTANWILALIVLALVPLTGLNAYLQMKFVKGFNAEAKKQYEEASQVAKDAVGNIRTVVSFCAEEKVMKLCKNKCEAPIEAGTKQGLVVGFGFGLSLALLFFVYAISFYVGAQLVARGETTFDNVFRVFFALTMAASVISQSSSLAPDSGKARSAAASVFSILDRQSIIDSSDESGMTLNDVIGDIEFRHVSFTYATRPDISIFQDLCLTIPAGKTVALVGESGCGKSTVISLLQRFYDPSSGSIMLDGIEIHKFQLRWLRQQMGLVSQEPVLFNDTIRANIAYGKGGDATEAEIIAAAELANAHKFISSLQQGYDTVVGERGVQLSGGQKQRVAIARAMVKNPKILLLDEATSALDAESEKVVQDALDRVMVNRTTVVVAHRLSTITNADVIAVVKNGVIAEKGKHDTLTQIKDGVYASLVALHMSAAS